MPLFTYEASTHEGVVRRGEIELPDRASVVEYLEKKNLIPVSIHDRASMPGVSRISFSLFDRITPFDRILLVRNLAASIRAGLNIVEAIDLMIVDAKKKSMREVLSNAKNNLINGRPLSDTFQTYRKQFPVIFSGMLRAGEASGKLDTTLDELAKHLAKDYDLRKKIRAAMAYPVLLLAMSFLITLMLLIFVLPRLANAFRQSKSSLPWITKFFLALSHFVTTYIWLDIILFVALVGAVIYSRRSDRGRRIFAKIVFHIPVARELVKKIALVRFTRTLSSLISSGTSFLDSLKLCADSIGNEYYRRAILNAAEEMKKGISFSQAMAEYPNLFPRFLVSLIVTGEKTGTMEQTLKTFADFYDEEVDYALKDLVTFLEPALLLVMGLIIGSIALAVLLPIYELVKHIT